MALSQAPITSSDALFNKMPSTLAALFFSLCWPRGSSGPVPALVILDMRSYHETLLLKIVACL